MPSFKAAFQNGTIPRVLFFAVIGLSARFSGHRSLSHINPWHRGRPYAQEAEKLLDLHDTSIVTIQACMLLAANFIADGEAMTECVYLTIACRMAMLIDLPNLKVNNRIEQEVNRRVWWSLLRYTEENMSFWGSQGSGPTFVNMHMNYHHIGQLLFYSFLGASLEIESESPVYEQTTGLATRCKQHAADLCDLIWTAKQRPETDIMHSLVGHDLVTSSTVQIHTLLFSPDDEEIAMARSRLERNFEMITDLHKYWPIVSVTISKLQKFHNACLRYKDETFHLDRWMLQFILEFSQPIQERSEEMLHRGNNEEVFDQLKNLIDA
ncbi:hypothetical protein Neosp_009808 [[Neocosmospora] mangrovei]